LGFEAQPNLQSYFFFLMGDGELPIFDSVILMLRS
jgi:hypothetical protein